MTGYLRTFRYSRLGSLLSPVLHAGGNLVRYLLRFFFPNGTIMKRLSRHGSYAMDYEFVFSDFSTWSEGHNSAFDFLIDSASGQSCVLDIGAHIGLATLPLCRSIEPAGRVYAFEPSDPNLFFLQKHIQVNQIQNVEVIEALVGAETAEAIPFLQYQTVSGMNSIAVSSRSNAKGWVTTKKPMITLDSFCRRQGLAPGLIKIDVEGAEFDVLKGALATIQTHKPTVVLSVHPRQLLDLGSSVEKLRKLIDDIQYTVHEPDGTSCLNQKLSFAEYILLPVSTKKDP